MPVIQTKVFVKDKIQMDVPDSEMPFWNRENTIIIRKGKKFLVFEWDKEDAERLNLMMIVPIKNKRRKA
jgi:hypothetical protein